MSINFKIFESKVIQGVWIIRPSVAHDDRGNIWTSFLKKDVEKLLPADLHFKHDKFSQSKRNVLRGIHGDEKSWKLVTCVYGEIYQVVVDCRKESNTYKQYDKFTISYKNQILVLMPPGLGNAYYVKSNDAVYHYKLAYKGSYIEADDQFSIKWNDPMFSIQWPTNDPFLSNRDQLK